MPRFFVLALSAAVLASFICAPPCHGQGWNVQSLGWLALPGYNEGIAEAEGYAYIAAGTAGLKIVDVRDPANMSLIGSLGGIGSAYSLALAGDYAYVSVPTVNVKIINVSDPTQPVLAGTYDLQGLVLVTDEERNLAFAAESGVLILDISDPVNPVEIASYYAVGEVQNLDVEGNYLYALEYYLGSSKDLCESRLLILDISDPADPTFVSSSCPDDWTSALDEANGYVYTVGYVTKLRVLDATDPFHPFEVSRVDFPGYPGRVKVFRNHAYITGDNTGGGICFRMFDCSDPAHPTESGNYQTPTVTWDLAIEGNIAFAAESGAIQALDCSDALHNEVAVVLTPFIQPIQIPASGGSFDFYLLASNGGPDNQTLDLWAKAILPDGHTLEPVLGPVTTVLDSGATMWIRHQYVPGYAPPGAYAYIVCAGDYSDHIWAADTLAFTKLATGDGPIVKDWGNTGANSDLGLSTIWLGPPGVYALEQNYPNPFNPTTAISYQLSADSRINLRIYDTAGKMVATLVNGWREAGNHQVTWDASGLPSGLYFCRMRAGVFTATQKMMLLK